MGILSLEKDRAVLVGVNQFNSDNGQDIDDSMSELEELAQTAGAQVVATTVQNRATIHPAYFIGKGKADEIAEFCKSNDVNLVIFNDELSGAQIRNLENMIGRSVVDRTTVILDIFAQRAQSREGQLQVELAQLRYRLPRLIGLGKELSRQRGGIGTRGPGEMKLETDRRHILRRIDEIKRLLEEVRKTRNIQRIQRIKSKLPIVALVGYTNSGKSTLMNAFLRKNQYHEQDREVYVRDKLFATLDISLRKIVLPQNREFLLTDTVGFVSKLPHDLVNAFKSTLEEINYADVLLHIIDASNKNYQLQMETTRGVLKDLGINNKNIINVYNKGDLLDTGNIIIQNKDTVIISAKTGENLDKLIEMIFEKIGQDQIDLTLLIPYDEGHIVAQLHEEAHVLKQKYLEKGVLMEARLGKSLYRDKYKQYEYFLL